MIDNINSLVGMKTDDAVKLLDGMNIKITDFSKPDKYHANVPQSKRIVKIIISGCDAELFVAGFTDEVTK